MASVRMGLSPVFVQAAKAQEKPGFLDWLDNAFQKKEGFSETSKGERRARPPLPGHEAGSSAPWVVDS